MRIVLALALAIAIAGTVSARGQAAGHGPANAALAKDGLVIVMRHASSPRTPPTAETAQPDNPGLDMQGVTAAQAAWLRTKVAERPASGNTLIVTHPPNLTRAFPDWGGTVADGESVVLRPNGRDAFEVVDGIPIDGWARRATPER